MPISSATLLEQMCGSPREPMGARAATGTRSNFPVRGPPWGGRPLLEVVFLKCIGLQLVPCCLCCLRVLHACTKQLLRPVVRVLLLLHLPRFPFHDSTGFRFCIKTNGRPYFLAPIGVPKKGLCGALWRAFWGAPLRPLRGVPPGLLWKLLWRFSGYVFVVSLRLV